MYISICVGRAVMQHKQLFRIVPELRRMKKGFKRWRQAVTHRESPNNVPASDTGLSYTCRGTNARASQRLHAVERGCWVTALLKHTGYCWPFSHRRLWGWVIDALYVLKTRIWLCKSIAMDAKSRSCCSFYRINRTQNVWTHNITHKVSKDKKRSGFADLL